MTIQPTVKTIEPDVQLTLPAATAYVVVDALDLYTRVGLGQFEDITSLARFGILKNAKGDTPSYDDIEDAEQHLHAAKKSLFGFPSNASHGIYSDKVAERFRTVWGVMKALRHRLAWDRTPEGGIQTSFDEPLRGEGPKGVTVSSGSLEDVLAQMPPDTMLTRVGEEWAIVRKHPTATDGTLQLVSSSHSIQTAIQKATNVLSGKPMVNMGF